MTQRRLRPSQGGRFLPPVVPSLLETHLIVERNEYTRRGPLLLMPDGACNALGDRILFPSDMHIEDVRWIP